MDALLTLPRIRMVLTDCDGCLTDGGMYYTEFGDEMKKFNTRDGMGFSLLRSKGIVTGIVTSESVKLNERRAQKMRVDILESGVRDKLPVVQRLSQERGIPLDAVAYIGDDINDLEVVRAVGFGCSPADGVPSVRAAARYVTNACGGHGVFREVADLILGSLEGADE